MLEPTRKKLASTQRVAVRLLVDLHSYPSEPWSIEPRKSVARPDIDLGTPEGITPESWVVKLTRYFEDAGFSVGRNTPYAGVIDAGASAAIMLEIRRDILGTPLDADRWDRMVRALSEMPMPQ
jgi:hypothetical protein